MSDLTIAGLHALYRSGRITPLDIAGDVLARIAAYSDPAVWISRIPEKDVLARAKALSENPAAKSLPLYGIPFAAKDNIDVAGLPTSAACPGATACGALGWHSSARSICAPKVGVGCMGTQASPSVKL